MKSPIYRLRSILVLLSIIALLGSADAQKRSKASKPHDLSGTPVMWQPVDVRAQDLFLGPGGTAMQPNLSRVTLVKEEKGGYSKKYRIKDAAGNTWVAKIGREAQSETAAIRFLAAIGYRTEINYLVPRLTIPGAGTFTDVRLEARPKGVDRQGIWQWGKTPFENTPQMRGLMLMMAFLNNWDMKSANNVILKEGHERQYVISDLGVSFGKTGSNPLPLFWRMGRSRNAPTDYARATFIKGVSGNHVKVVFNGKNRSRMRGFTTADARWLADQLSQLSDAQIRDAFRAANYSPAQIDLLTQAVENRIDQLVRAGSGSYTRMAGLR